VHLFYGIVFKHSRGITILFVLLWFSIAHYSSLFQYFSTIIPTLVKFFNILAVNDFHSEVYQEIELGEQEMESTFMETTKKKHSH